MRGLTTAATIWLTAAVGTACGAGLPVLQRFVARHRREPPVIRLSYLNGHGVLRAALAVTSRFPKRGNGSRS